MKRLLFILGLGIIFFSCEKETETSEVNLGYSYFPLESGNFYVYKVDSIYHDQPNANIDGIHDTVSYFRKEKIDSVFLDALKEPSYRIVRYIKSAEEDPWRLTEIWAAKSTASNGQRVDDNKRYVRLVFPISVSSRWDGNALNNLDEHTHSYSEIGMPRTYDQLDFLSTILVNQHEFQSLVNDEKEFEVYAEDVGLVEKYFKNLKTRTEYTFEPIAEHIQEGVEYHLTILEHGKE